MLSLEQIEQLARWLFGDALSWANIVQVPALFLTGAVAWLLCHPVRAHVVAWIESYTKFGSYSGKKASRFPIPSGICMFVPMAPIETDCLLTRTCMLSDRFGGTRWSE